jgi:hypothetical protein
MDDKQKNNPTPRFQFIPADPREWNPDRKIPEFYAPLVDGPGDPINEIIKEYGLDDPANYEDRKAGPDDPEDKPIRRRRRIVRR